MKKGELKKLTKGTMLRINVKDSKMGKVDGVQPYHDKTFKYNGSYESRNLESVTYFDDVYFFASELEIYNDTADEFNKRNL